MRCVEAEVSSGPVGVVSIDETDVLSPGAQERAVPVEHDPRMGAAAIRDIPVDEIKTAEILPAAAAWCRENDRFERVYPVERIVLAPSLPRVDEVSAS